MSSPITVIDEDSSVAPVTVEGCASAIDLAQIDDAAGQMVVDSVGEEIGVVEIGEADSSTSIIADDSDNSVVPIYSEAESIVLDRFDPEIGIVEIECGILAIPQPKYTHLQNTPSSVWIVNHNLGVRPIVQVYTLGGMVVTCDILHNSSSQVTLSFSLPISGFAQFT